MSLRSKCQKIWLRAAAGEDVTLYFNSPGDMERARLAIYDACRRATNKELLQAREDCEIRKNKATCSITVALKSKNPFFSAFEGMPGMEEEEQPEDAIEASLRAFEEKMAKEQQEEASPIRVNNPYFKREE